MPSKITQNILARKNGVSQQFVSYAILGKRNSRKAVRIRHEYGNMLQSLAASYLNQDK
jgi:hypothetical protein